MSEGISRRLTIQETKENVLVDIRVWPDEVVISTPPNGASLTPEQAAELASLLLTAVNDSLHLHWADEADLETWDDRLGDTAEEAHAAEQRAAVKAILDAKEAAE